MPILQALLVFFIVWSFSYNLAPHANSVHAQVQSVVLQTSLVLGLPLLVSKLLKLELSGVFKLRSTSLRNLSLTLCITCFLIILLDEIGFLQSKWFIESSSVDHEIQRLLKVSSLAQFLGLLFSMGVVPAISEECLFRGYLLDRLYAADHQWWSIMISSVLFGIFHRDFHLWLPATLSGVVLAVTVVRSGSLFNSILSHFIINAWGIVVTNSAIPLYIPWLSHPRHVPFGLQVICWVGIFWSGKSLNKVGRNNGRIRDSKPLRAG